MPLALDDYRTLVDLDRPFTPEARPAAPDEFDDVSRDLLTLLAADPASAQRDATDPRALVRALLTVRAPGPLPPAAGRLLAALLAGERAQRPTVEATALPTIAAHHPGTGYPAAAGTALWRGDITTLRADAIVNAANSALLGCFQPAHRCIDNVIHAAAGPRLRDDCHTVMSLQGRAEPTGSAKITRGYHLPAPYVLHTVGPIVDGRLRPEHAAGLAAAYRSCLDLAASVGRIRTVAFCGISTGVFGYPRPAAARVALATVADWLDTYPGRLDRIVFDVFSADDLHVYQQALTDWDQP
jgi:O-acetyl-ADP-ribose deacetylase (regulator of RNase III)